MKLFIKKVLLFITLVLCFHFILYSVLNFYHFSVANFKKSLFVYGDSQTFQGLDLVELEKSTGLNICSAARHGAGIYDFYTFVNQVPKNSKILLSISKLSQVRPNKYEANTSPLTFNSLFDLYSSNKNYPFKNIFMRGIKLPIKKYYKSKSSLYPNKDSITVKQPISIFKNRYSISQKKLLTKQNMYLNGVQKLIDKGCQITFIQFPFSPSLKKIDKNSKLKSNFNYFNKRISSLYTDFKTDTINLSKKTNIMYDHSHLNQHGATMLSKKLGEKLKVKQYTTMYIVR